MKRMLLISLIATCLLPAADVAGRWDGPTDMKNGNGEQVVFHLLLRQEGAKVSGGVWTEDHDENNPRPIQNGVLKGTELHLEVPQKADAVVTFDLALNTEPIDGTIRFQGPSGPQEIKISFQRQRAR